MKIVLFASILALLLIVQQLPTCAQGKNGATKASVQTDVVNRQKSPPELLGNPGAACACSVPCPSIDSLQITYACVEQMPKPPGRSAESYLNTLSEQAQMPLGQPKREGRVWVYFVVTPSGELTDFRISRGLSPAYNAEAIRLVKAQPVWTPGYLNGQAVRVQILAYVLFRT
jgi:hypothetical protein